MPKIQEAFAGAAKTIKELPPAAKVAIAGAGGLAIWWLFKRGDSSGTLNSESTTDQGLVIYPYAAADAGSYSGRDESSYLSDYSSGSSSGYVGGLNQSQNNDIYSGDLVTRDQFTEWEGRILERISSRQEENSEILPKSTFTSSAGDASALSYTPDELLMLAQSEYGAAVTASQRAQAAAAGQAAKAAGATDEGAAKVWQKLTGNTQSITNMDKQLQEAQAAYGAATTAAERQKAAAAGQAARAAGATDAGAAKVWQQQKNTAKTANDTSSANKQLQQAQAAYRAAKTDADRKAAAAAGQAARNAGATEEGAKAEWGKIK